MQRQAERGERGVEREGERGVGKREGQVLYLEPILPLHVLEHVPADSIFHNDGQVLIGKKHLLELDEVGMQQIAVIADLPLHILGYLRIREKINIRPSVETDDVGGFCCLRYPSPHTYISAHQAKFDYLLI
jgi:hypothetical protein